MSFARALPEPAEARALADELRGMMASGRVDQSVLRRAANALEDIADQLPMPLHLRPPMLDWRDVVEGDPFRGQIMSSFEGGEDGDGAAIDAHQ